MSIIFTGPTKHGAQTFAPSVPLAFEDEGAEAYFVAAGFAKDSKAEPVMTFPAGSVDIDPTTVFADGPNKGQLVVEG